MQITTSSLFLSLEYWRNLLYLFTGRLVSKKTKVPGKVTMTVKLLITSHNVSWTTVMALDQPVDILESNEQENLVKFP